MNKKIPIEIATSLILAVALSIGAFFYVGIKKETPTNAPAQDLVQAKSEFKLASEYCEEFGGMVTQWENSDKKMEWKCGTSKNDCELFAFYQKKCPMRKIITLKPDTETCASFKKLFDSYRKSTIAEEEAGLGSNDYKTLQGKLCVVSTSWNSVLRSNDKSGELWDTVRKYLEKSQWKTSGGVDGPSGSAEYYENGYDQLTITLHSEPNEIEDKKYSACIENNNTDAAIEHCTGNTRGTFSVFLSSGKAVNVEEIYDPWPFKRLNYSRPKH